jgi:hypothetical protein
MEGEEGLPSLQELDKLLPVEGTTELEPGPAKPEGALKAIEKALPSPTAEVPKAAPAVLTATRTSTPRPLPTATPLPAKPAPTAPPSVPMATEKPKATASVPSGSQPSSPGEGTRPTDAFGAPPATAPKPGSSVPSGKAPAGPAAASAPAVAAGGLSDYFPTGTGMKWNYEYLKAGADGMKKARSVECTDVQTFPNGTIRASFTVTEASPVKVGYSIYNGLVQRTLVGSKALGSDFAFKFPRPGVPSAWTATGVDGTAKTCSASFGKAQVYEKIYPDCVVVKEKVGTQTLFTFYARGIGLVALEVYGAGMKLDQARSYALVSGPTN